MFANVRATVPYRAGSMTWALPERFASEPLPEPDGLGQMGWASGGGKRRAITPPTPSLLGRP